MSEREIAFAMIDSFPDDQIGNVISMLRTMQQTIENALHPEVPNAETIESMEEIKEMIRTGSGEHWKGSTADLFASILAEDD
jgi:hypothetical protein